MVVIAEVNQFDLNDYREIIYKGVIICAFKWSKTIHHFKTIGLANNTGSKSFAFVRKYINTQLKIKFNPLTGTEVLTHKY
jgi:hypothetical protein